MSKLYVSATTDKVKSYRTARGHKEASTAVKWNWNGGNTEDGAAYIDALHNGDRVELKVEVYSPCGYGKVYATIIVRRDGTTTATWKDNTEGGAA